MLRAPYMAMMPSTEPTSCNFAERTRDPSESPLKPMHPNNTLSAPRNSQEKQPTCLSLRLEALDQCSVLPAHLARAFSSHAYLRERKRYPMTYNADHGLTGTRATLAFQIRLSQVSDFRIKFKSLSEGPRTKVIMLSLHTHLASA